MSGPRSKVRWVRAGVTMMLGLLTGGPAVFAANAPSEGAMKKIRVAYSALSGSQAPLWVAYEKGFFRKHGLEPEIVFLESGSKAVEALVSGEVAAAQVAGSSVLQSRLQGADVVLIGGFLNTLDYQLMVHPEIVQPQRLKGKTLAVSRFGSSSDFATRYALKRYGLDPGKDVTLLEIGSQPARFAALQDGRIQGAMIAVPLTAKAKKMDFRVLADLQMLGLEYQHTGMATTRALIRSDPDLLARAMKAMVEAIHYFKTHRREALGILQKYLGGEDAEAMKETYEVIGLALMPEKPYPTLRGIQIMLTELAAEEKAQAARADDFVDLTFVKDLDRSGFIDRLYNSPAPAPTVQRRQTPAPMALAKKFPVAGSATGRVEHTIEVGDTLAILAMRYYGDGKLWGRIYQANRDGLRNPDLLYVGQRLMIPGEGLRRSSAEY